MLVNEKDWISLLGGGHIVGAVEKGIKIRSIENDPCNNLVHFCGMDYIPANILIITC